MKISLFKAKPHDEANNQKSLIKFSNMRAEVRAGWGENTGRAPGPVREEDTRL